MPLGIRNQRVAGCGLHHISVQTFDWEAALRFYRDDLGMLPAAEFRVGERRFMLLDMGDGCYIELNEPPVGAMPGAPGYTPVAHIALAVHDARATLEQMRAVGYAVTAEPKRVHLAEIEAWVAFFKGPNGEVIELFQVCG